MNAPVSTPLTDPEIDILVGRYVEAMARYEETARLVEDRLRRALRANAVRALLGSRAKHPEDLRGKLARKRSDERYRFSTLDARMNEIVTDLAGCRVMVYRFSDVENVERIVREALELSSLPGAFERHQKKSGYRASHFLVRIGDEVDRLSLRGAICEVQIASLAAHVFNELEHDIAYKDHDCPPTEAEQESLAEVRHMTWFLDRSVERLLVERAKAVQRQTVPLKDPEELQFALEQGVGRRLHGEFVRLFRLLGAVIQPFTPAALGSVHDLLQRGEQRAHALKIDDADDVVRVTLAMFDDYADEFEQLVREQRGPATLLKRSVLLAAEERRNRA